MDYSEILSRAWKITLKYKVLWAAGFVMMLIAFLILPIMLFFMFVLFSSKDPSQWLDHPGPWIGIGVGFLLYTALSYGIGSFVRPSVVAAVVKVERGEQHLSIGELFRGGLPYYWRFLGLMALFAVCIMLISSVISGIQIIGTIVTMGLASLCLTPLSFLLYPLLYIGIVWLEFAETAIVVDGRGVMDSIRRGWELLRANKTIVFVMAIIMYLGIGTLAGLLLFPFLIPIFFAPAFAMDQSLPREILWIAGIGLALLYPIVAFLQGIAFVFMKTGWILTYLGLAEKQIVSADSPLSPAAARNG
jgi:hypothetical protein